MLKPVHIGIAVFIVLSWAGRYRVERAIQQLTPEQRLNLIDNFSPYFRVFASAPLMVILVLFLGVSELPLPLVLPAFFGLWLLFFSYYVWLQLYILARVRRLGTPESYLRVRAQRAWLTGAGFFAFCLAQSYVFLH